MEPNTNQPNPSPFIPQAAPVPPTAPVQNQMPPQMQTPPPMPPQPNMQPVYAPTPKKSKTLIAILIVVIALAIVGGVGAYVLNAKRPEPKVVMKNAISAMSTVRSFAYSGEITGSGTTTPQPGVPFSGGTFSFTSNGKIDIRDLKNKAADINLGFKIHSAENGDTLNADASTEIMVLEKKGYAVLKDLNISYIPAKPNIGLSAIIGAIQGAVSGIKNQWVSFDITNNTTPTTISVDETKKFEEKLMSFDYIDAIDTLPDETINGISNYHYRITLNKEKTQALFKDAEKTSILIQNNDLAAAIASRATSDASNADQSFEIWIGKKDWYVYRLALLEGTVKDDASGSAVTMSAKLDLSEFNVAMNLVPPAKSTTIEEFQQQLMGSIMQSPRGATTTTHSTSTVKPKVR